MYYPEELVEEVRVRNDIVDVVSGYVRLQKKGANHWGCCPFHNEKTPSFAVNGAKQMYHCFGCGAGGNVYTFVMNYENYTFPEAVKMLAARAGVSLPEAEYDEEQKQRQNHRQQLLDVNREAATFFYYQLRSPQGQVGYRYLADRELSDETMRKFGLGYTGKSGAGLIRHLKQKIHIRAAENTFIIPVFQIHTGIIQENPFSLPGSAFLLRAYQHDPFAKLLAVAYKRISEIILFKS